VKQKHNPRPNKSGGDGSSGQAQNKETRSSGHNLSGGRSPNGGYAWREGGKQEKWTEDMDGEPLND
jgi:hypothetical protein